MRAFAFFALLALTASAFNITDYHLGVANGLGFNLNETQDGQTCLNALAADFQAIADLIEARNFDNITLGLGDLVIQVQDDLQTTCKPYFADYYSFLTAHINISNLTEIMKENIEQNYPYLISQLGMWVQSISEGEDFNGGYLQDQIFEILFGIQQFPSASAAPQITPVPFNATEFFIEYNAALFQMFNIDAQVNITGLVECADYIQNATLTFLYMKENLSTMDFEQKLDAFQYLIGLTLDSVRNCGAAYDVMELVYGPVVQAFSEDPVNFTLEALENLAISFPEVQQTLENEIIDIETGNYSLAGENEGARIFDVFGSIAEFD